MQAPGVAQDAVADVFGRHRDAWAGVLEHREVDDLGEPLGDEGAEGRVLAVEDVLVQVELVVLVARDALPLDPLGEVVDVSVEIAGAHVPALGIAEPGALLGEDLHPFDAHAGEAGGGVAGLGEPGGEPVEDDDVAPRQTARLEPADDGIDEFEAGAEERCAHGVDLKADHIVAREEEREALRETGAGRCRKAGGEHGPHHLGVDLPVAQRAGVMHRHHSPRERARQGGGRARHLEELVEVRLRLARRFGGAEERGCAEDETGGGGADAEMLDEVAPGDPAGRVHGNVAHGNPHARIERRAPPEVGGAREESCAQTGSRVRVLRGKGWLRRVRETAVAGATVVAGGAKSR